MGSFNKLSDSKGMTESFEGDQKHWSYDEQGYASFREVSTPNNIPPENKAKVENLCCPLLYIVGEDDLSCAAIEKADEIEKKLKDVGRSHLFTRLSYPGAGHLIEPPYTPNAHASMWTKQLQKLITLWGGHLVPHAATQEDAWKRTLEFMERHLRGKEYKYPYDHFGIERYISHGSLHNARLKAHPTVQIQVDSIFSFTIFRK